MIAAGRGLIINMTSDVAWTDPPGAAGNGGWGIGYAISKGALHRVAGVQAERLIAVTGATVRGVVYGILGTAVVQGILTAFGLWLSGVPRPVLLGGVAGLLAVLPVGAPLVWIPASIWLLSSGHVGWGIFLAIYGAGAISGSDSLIRPWFISRGAQLPFLLTVLGVLGGALAFGAAATSGLVPKAAAQAKPHRIDVHHHISPPSWVDALKSMKKDSPPITN